MNHQISIISSVLTAVVLLTACGNVDRTIRHGDAAMALGEYAEAAGQYRRAYSRIVPKDKAKRGAVAYKMGRAYARYGNVARAVSALRNAERYQYTDTTTLRDLGHLLRMQAVVSASLFIICCHATA